MASTAPKMFPHGWNKGFLRVLYLAFQLRARVSLLRFFLYLSSRRFLDDRFAPASDVMPNLKFSALARRWSASLRVFYSGELFTAASQNSQSTAEEGN